MTTAYLHAAHTAITQGQYEHARIALRADLVAHRGLKGIGTGKVLFALKMLGKIDD